MACLKIPHPFISICSGCTSNLLLLPVSPVFLCSHTSFGLLCLPFFIDWLLLSFYNLLNLQEFCSALIIFDFPHPGPLYSFLPFASHSASLPPFVGVSSMSFLWCVHLIAFFPRVARSRCWIAELRGWEGVLSLLFSCLLSFFVGPSSHFLFSASRLSLALCGSQRSWSTLLHPNGNLRSILP